MHTSNYTAWSKGTATRYSELCKNIDLNGDDFMTPLIKQLICASPIFHAEDFEKTMNYYRDVLGFTIAWTYDNYGCVERDGVELHVSGKVTDADRSRAEQPRTTSSDLYVFVADVDSLYAEIKERGADCMDEPKNYPYGMRDFGVRDINGYVLTFGQNISAHSNP
jgi:uncharacterized glyoxalase superfamily protein PhnB